MTILPELLYGYKSQGTLKKKIHTKTCKDFSSFFFYKCPTQVQDSTGEKAKKQKTPSIFAVNPFPELSMHGTMPYVYHSN